MRASTRIVVVAVLAGCGDRALTGGETSDTGSSGAITTSDGGGTSTGAVESTGTPTTESSADESTATTTDTSTGATEPACEPAPQDVAVTLEFAGSLTTGPLSSWQSGAACIVAAIDARAESTALDLDCVDDGDGHALGVLVTYSTSASVAIDLSPGDAVQLSRHLWTLFWFQEFVALHDAEGEVVLAWLTGENVPGASGGAPTPMADFFAPLEVSFAYPCEAECDDEQDTEDCGCPRRFALTFTLGDESTSVIDAGTGTLAAGGLSLFVESASDSVGGTGESCGLDRPARRVEALAIRTR